ncbi:MAG: hypothetical protein AAGJ83_06170, partial [Planctomycetota bacterium]
FGIDLTSQFAFAPKTGESLIGFDPVRLEFSSSWLLGDLPSPLPGEPVNDSFALGIGPVPAIPEPSSLLICFSAAISVIPRRRRQC